MIPDSIEPATVPNLDCATDSDLREFADFGRDYGASLARHLFPSRPQGYRMATARLAQYARLAIQAREQRLAGRIDRAVALEESAQRVYLKLPEWARW